jgi:hypothetical protein
MAAALKTILSFGILASAIRVTAFSSRSVTVIFFDSLALTSATASRSPTARSAPASEDSSEIFRSAMTASSPHGDCY